MLYSLYDKKMSALEPMMNSAKITRSLLSHPSNPWSWTTQGRMVSASVDVIESLSTLRPKPQWNLDSIMIGKNEVKVKNEVIEERSFCSLRRFSLQGDLPNDQANKPRETILVLAPMSGHFATLLRDTVKRLLQNADVYITDWKDAKHVPLEEGHFGLNQYIDYIRDFLSIIGTHKDGKAGGCHCVAVCQPAPILMMATALMAEDNNPFTPRSITLMGGPIDARAASTLVTQLAENRPISWFKQNNVHVVPNRYEGSNRHVYPGFLQLRAFWSMNPARHNMAHWNIFKHLVEGDGESAEKTQGFYDEYMAVLDVTAEFYLETVYHIFQKHSLALGTMEYHNRLIDLSKIKQVGLLTVEASLDDISAPGQTIAAHALCPNIPEDMKKVFLAEGVGHYGIFNGRRWRDTIAPQIESFIQEINLKFQNN